MAKTDFGFVEDPGVEEGFGFVDDEWDPGEDASSPLQEQHPEVDRFWLKNLAASPEAMKRALEVKGFQVGQHLGGYNFSIKKPTEKQWKVVDPKGFDLKDITDVLGDVGTGIASGVAGTLAAGTALPTGPGAIAAGAAGGAAGAAGAEALKQTFAKATGVAGLDPTIGEATSRVGEEAAFGAGGELLSYGLGHGIKAAGAAWKASQAGRKGLLQKTKQLRQAAKLRDVIKQGGGRAIQRAGEILEAVPNIASRGREVAFGGASREERDVLLRQLKQAAEGQGSELAPELSSRTAIPTAQLKAYAQKLGVKPELSPAVGGVTSPVGLTTLAGFGIGAGAAKVGAGLIGTQFLGRGLRATGLALMRDGSGRNLASMAAKAPPGVARLIDKTLGALERRGVPAYKASVYLLLHEAPFREFLRAGEEEE